MELAQAGTVVAAGDYRALAQAINRLRLLPLNERKAQGDRGRAYLVAHHSYPMLARRLAEKLDALVRLG